LDIYEFLTILKIETEKGRGGNISRYSVLHVTATATISPSHFLSLTDSPLAFFQQSFTFDQNFKKNIPE
jgi:hypothetical protein